VNVHVTGAEPAFVAVTVTVAPGIRFATSKNGSCSAVTPSPTTPVSDAATKLTSGGPTTDHLRISVEELPAMSVAITARVLTPDDSPLNVEGQEVAGAPFSEQVYVMA
jgi:hypothetical protein